MGTISEDFCILEFPPHKNLWKQDYWKYSTCGMSDLSIIPAIELHLFSYKQDETLIELLTAIAYYHRISDARLNLHHTVNFGRPWENNSICIYGLISLPYVHGPSLEIFNFQEYQVKCYWLIPITFNERNFKKEYGIELLEEKFEESKVDLLNPHRLSIV